MSDSHANFRTATEFALVHSNPAVRKGAQNAAALFADYDALLARCEAAEARLAEAERLLQECFDARATTPSIGLVYRVGHYLNHRNDATQEPTR